MVDQRPQVLAGALLSAAFEQEAVETGVDEVFVEGGVVLEIDFRPAASDLVERRLGDEEVTVLDQVGHLAVEEGQQQGADMGAVDIGVGHDDDLVIAQLVEVELFGADRRPERLDQGTDFL